MQGSLSTIIVFILYLALMVAIGLVFYSKSKNLSDYFLGGRNLNSWVTAISAQASDMSGLAFDGPSGGGVFFGRERFVDRDRPRAGDLSQLENRRLPAEAVYGVLRRFDHDPGIS